MDLRPLGDEALALLPHSFTITDARKLQQYGSTATTATTTGRQRTTSVPARRCLALGPHELLTCKSIKMRVRSSTNSFFRCALPASRGAIFSAVSMPCKEKNGFYGLTKKPPADSKISSPRTERQNSFFQSEIITPSAALSDGEISLNEDNKEVSHDVILSSRQNVADLVSAGANEFFKGRSGVEKAPLDSPRVCRESQRSADENMEINCFFTQLVEGENGSKFTGYFDEKNNCSEKENKEKNNAVVNPTLEFLSFSKPCYGSLDKGEGNQISSAHCSLAIKKSHTPSFREQVVFAKQKEEVVESDEISWSAALLNFFFLSFSGTFVIAFTFAFSVLPLAFVGNYLGELCLTGASVGYFVLSIVVLYPTLGMTVAIDTLCSHEYGRDSSSQRFGIFLQRGIFVSLAIFIPTCFVIYKIDYLLLKIYSAEVTSVAMEFISYMPLLVPPMIVFAAFTKFLFNQMQSHMPLIALAAGFFLSFFVQIKLTPMGVRYTMIGMCITIWWQLFVIIVMTFYNSQTRHSFGGFSLSQALQRDEVIEYLKLAIPSAILICAEASSFDFTILLCASLGKQAGAAWSGIMNVLFIFASIAGGMSASACMNVGYCVGAHRPNSLRTFVKISFASVLVVGVVNSTIFYCFFDFLMSLFGTKGATLELARKTLFMLPLFHIADSVQYMTQGIFSGLGKNHLGAFILLVSLWGVGIPLAFLFGVYLQYGIFGVCLGMTTGLCIEAPAVVAFLYKMDYNVVCDAFSISYRSQSSAEEEIKKENTLVF